MGLFRYLLQKAGLGGGVFVHSFQSGRPYFPNKNFHALVSKYTSYVYACANKNATAVAETPLRLFTARPKGKAKSKRFPVGSISAGQRKWLEKRFYRKFAISEEVEEVFSHPIIDLLQNVNEFMNEFELIELLTLFQDITGNAYWLVDRGESAIQVPTEIWPLFPQLMKVIPSKANFIQGYEYTVGNEKIIFPPDVIIHFKYPNPNNPFYGMGPLEASVVAADLGMAMNVYETQNFRNAGHIDMAMVLPAEAGDPSPEAKKKMEADWRRKFSGLRNTGKLPFITGGAELVNLQFSPKDMGFLKGRKASLEEVAAVFGVPLSKLTVENVNRANAREGNFSYMKDTIWPKLKRIEQKLNEQFVPMFDESLFVAFDNPVPEDKEFRLKEAASRLKTGETTINEERLIDNLEPVEYGDIPILPASMRPLGSEIEVVPDKGDDKRLKGINIGFAAPNFTDNKFVAALSEYFRSIEDAILIRFDEDIAAFKNICKSSVEEELAASWFDFQKWNRELEVIETPFLRAHLLSGGASAVNKLGSEVAFEMETPSVIRAIADHRISTVSSVNSTALKKLRRTIADGIEAGEGAAKIRKRLQNTFGDMSKHQALLLARTETIWAWNEGAVQGFKQSGVITRMVWVATGDERTCEFCPEMDGIVVSVDGKFWDKGDSMTGNEGGTMNFHYEKVQHPPLHPLCRCTIAPEIENI